VATQLGEIEALLRREGREDLVGELRRVVAAGEAAAAYTRTVSEVTRALLENEKTYRLVFANEQDPMSLIDAETGMFLEVNEAWTRLYGYARDEALRLKFTVVSAEPTESERMCGQLAAGDVARVSVRWHRSRDGAVFPVELSTRKFVLGGRQVACSVMRDITSRRNTELELERTQSGLRALIEGMPDGVLVHVLGPIVYMNPAARRLLGYGEDDSLEELTALDIVHPDYRERVVAQMSEMIRTGGSAPAFEEALLRKDGTSVLAEVSAFSASFDGERAIIAIMRDVSARKAVETQLVMSDRLAAIGRLAASVGHELNNPLGYVLGNVELMKRELDRARTLDEAVAGRLAQHVGMIREGATRMRDIVRDLKTLARGDGEAAIPVDLQAILDVCANMAEREIVQRARLVRELGGKNLVMGSEARLGQVFLNLLLNAAQAIPEGRPEENEVCIRVRREPPGKVTIEVRDTGTGIAPEHRDRIFEPFFTTKQGEGTGLGLSICHRIVTSAGGALSAAPNDDRGTTFRVVLPTASEGPGT
jgi:PAS domain S-box-containing protein